MFGDNQVLVVVGSGEAAYRRYLLRAVARHHRLVLVDPRSAETGGLFEAHHRVDPTCVASHARLVAELTARHDVAGVLTFHDPYVEAGARLAEQLGVARTSVASLTRTRDKFASRQAWRSLGVPSAAYRLVRTEDEARVATDEIGYPVVVKPRALAASVGVSLARNPVEAAAAFRQAAAWVFADVREHRGDVLVEEYLTGPEISVDCVVTDGVATPLVWARKQLGPLPDFEEIGHIVADSTEVTAGAAEVAAVTQVLEAAHAALDIENAVTHAELRLTPTGPRMVELNGRSGGDLIPYLGSLATGIDIGLVSADVATGRAPDVRSAARGTAGIRFLHPSAEGIVEKQTLALRFAPPDWLHRVEWLVDCGTPIAFTPTNRYEARVGYAIATADDIKTCTERLDEIERQVVITTRPA